jgi:hypothetical protein
MRTRAAGLQGRRDVTCKGSGVGRIDAKWKRHRSRYEERIESGYVYHRVLCFVAFLTKLRPVSIIAAPSSSAQVRAQ